MQIFTRREKRRGQIWESNHQPGTFSVPKRLWSHFGLGSSLLLKGKDTLCVIVLLFCETEYPPPLNSFMFAHDIFQDTKMINPVMLHTVHSFDLDVVIIVYKKEQHTDAGRIILAVSSHSHLAAYHLHCACAMPAKRFTYKCCTVTIRAQL